MKLKIKMGANHQEDPYEAWIILMTEFERIIKHNGTLTHELYHGVITTKRYEPVSAPFEMGKRDLTLIPETFCTKELENDFHICLELDKEKESSLDTLMLAHLNNPNVTSSEPADFKISSGECQTFKVVEERVKFDRIPTQLTIVLKRFGGAFNIAPHKINSTVSMPREYTLPMEATTEGTSANYKLVSFIVHDGGYGGGHYITYKVIGDNWVELNDGLSRYVSTEEIDSILNGKKGRLYTSYMHKYVRDSKLDLVPMAKPTFKRRQRIR